MATILDVLKFHPTYKGLQWTWTNNAIDPTDQAELSSVLKWLDAAVEPTYAALDALRGQTDQVITDNQSPDTTDDEDVLDELLLRPKIHRKIVRRMVDFQDEVRSAVIQIRNEIRTIPGHESFDISFDATIQDRWLTLRNKLRDFDAG